MTEKFNRKEYTFAEMIANKRQLFFFFVLLAVACFIVPFTLMSKDQYYKALKEKPADYTYPQIGDLKICFVYAVVMWGIELTLKDIGYRLIEPIFPALDDVDLRELKVQKAALSFFKVWFYGSLFSWGFFAMREDASFFWLVGGSGNFANSVKDYPYLVRTNPNLETYMLASAGYYIKATI